MNRTFRFSISSPVARGLVKRRPRFAAALLNCTQLFEIVREDLVRLHAVLEALQVPLELGRASPGQGINHPILVALDFHHSALAKVTEVFGNFYLRFAQ